MMLTTNGLANVINRGHQYSSSVLLLMIMSRMMICQCSPSHYFPSCLQCDDLNRQSKGQCATNYKDCGDCKQGFIQDEEDWRICYAVETLEDPVKDIVQRTGSEVILKCIFNTKVWCVWTQDRKEVDIGSGSTYSYEYLSPDAGKTKSYDCSIRIEHLSMDDIGQWQCQSMADGNIDSVKGRSTQIAIKHDEGQLIPNIKLNNVNVSGQEIDMGDLQEVTRSEGDLILTNVLECHVDMLPSELLWGIDGDFIAGGKLNDSTIHLKENHLLVVMETYKTSLIKLTCLVRYNTGESFTSYVNIRVHGSSARNELEETFSDIGNVNDEPIRLSIMVTIILLAIIFVIISIVAIILIVVKMTQNKNYVKFFPLIES